MKVTAYLSCAVASALLAGTVQGRPEPFSLRITTPKQEIHSGSPIEVKLTVTNDSREEITLVDTNRSCDYKVDVRDAQDHLAPETEYKRELKCSFHVTFGRRMLRVLKPQKSFDDEIFVNELYDLRRPDKYTIQVSRTVPKELGSGTVKSNTITVTVTE